MNAAKRLHGILVEGKKQKQHASWAETWPKILELPANDLPALYQAIVGLLSLVSEVEASIRSIPEANHDLYLRSMPTIRNVLAVTNLNQQWSSFVEKVPDTALGDLDFCADLLSKHSFSGEISRDELTWIASEIAGLIEDVIASDLPKSLRLTVLDLLQTIQEGVTAYRVRGPRELRKALATSIGELFLRYPECKETKDAPVLGKFWQFVVKLDKIVCKALEYQPLLELALPRLLGP